MSIFVIAPPLTTGSCQSPESASIATSVLKLCSTAPVIPGFTTWNLSFLRTFTGFPVLGSVLPITFLVLFVFTFISILFVSVILIAFYINATNVTRVKTEESRVNLIFFEVKVVPLEKVFDSKVLL